MLMYNLLHVLLMQRVGFLFLDVCPNAHVCILLSKFYERIFVPRGLLFKWLRFCRLGLQYLQERLPDILH